MKIAVVMFPGSGGVKDVVYAYSDILKQEVYTVWHQQESLGDPDILILPGGSAFADYLRPGALASPSPVCSSIIKYARDKRPVLGIGNGFQILCELGILPGALIANSNNRFLNTQTHLLCENDKSVWTHQLEQEDVINLPVSCYFGRYYADKRTLKDLEEMGHVAFRFCDNEGDVDTEQPFNASSNAIAGILNRHENVLGIMAHPERAIESFMGTVDGLEILNSALTPVTANQDSASEAPKS